MEQEEAEVNLRATERTVHLQDCQSLKSPRII